MEVLLTNGHGEVMKKVEGQANDELESEYDLKSLRVRTLGPGRKSFASSTFEPITPSHALYIKLGQGGAWEKECITENQTLRLGYQEVSHDLCLRGSWELVQEELKAIRKDVGAATRDTNQIRLFYESDETVLWATFFGDRLYWCFSKPEIKLLADISKTRPVIGQWRSTDITGEPLQKNQLSGKLLSMEGFRGTICSVKEVDYLVHKINAEVSTETKEAVQALSTLERKIEIVIRGLHWKDFEILVDLIFRQAGWQRVGVLGGGLRRLLTWTCSHQLRPNVMRYRLSRKHAVRNSKPTSVNLQTCKAITAYILLFIRLRMT